MSESIENHIKKKILEIKNQTETIKLKKLK